MTNAAGFQLYGGAVITVLSSKTSQVKTLYVVGSLPFYSKYQHFFITTDPLNQSQGLSLKLLVFVSSDRSSCTDDGPLYIRGGGGGNFFRF